MIAFRVLPLAAFLASTASAHVFMNYPPGFKAVDKSPLTNGNEPQGGTTANYPCKAPDSSFYDWSKSTTIAQGDQSYVQFNGTAVHGGGSCQLSLSKDMAPTKDSDFKVIHSIEGGCPQRNIVGNAPDNGDPDDTLIPDLFKYTMNPKIEPGNYTFAWTWFNKVGNREMYMNCAPITVTEGSSKTKRDNVDWQDWDKLPSIMVANNYAAPGCKSTADGSSVKFPDPGTSLEDNGGNSVSPDAGAYCQAPNMRQTSPGTPPTAPATPSGYAPDAPQAAAPQAAAPQGYTQPPAQGPAAVLSSHNMQVAAPTPSSPAASPYTPGECLAGQQPCQAADGELFCFSTSQWGTCNDGCAISLAVAPGTTCSDGKISALPVGRSRMHKRRGHTGARR